MPFCLLLGPFAALHATVPRLFPVNRLPLYAISVWGWRGGSGGEEEGKAGKTKHLQLSLQPGQAELDQRGRVM